MSTDLVRTAAPVPSPSRLGQGTAIEQSRAAAEVHARVVVAQQVPRRIDQAERDMLASCAMTALAERAFYKYPRGKQTVTGASIHLARELARCWGNVDYGIHELRRDDDAGQSEMLAWAWDLQTNTRSGQIFIVPHGRDTKDGRVVLVELRDIYENNANMGARRLREAIFSVLPPWFTEAAKEACAATLKRGDGTPLADRIGKAIAGFAELGVREAQLVQKVGRPCKVWTELDLAQLVVSFRSIQRGELTREDEFGVERSTAADIQAAAAAATEPGPATRQARDRDSEAPASPEPPQQPSEPVEKPEGRPAPTTPRNATAARRPVDERPDGDWPATAQPPPDPAVTS